MDRILDLTPNFDLGALNTLGLPSHARLGMRITDAAQVPALAAMASEAGLPLHIIGGGSNLVLRERIDAVIGLMATSGHHHENRLVTAQAGEDWSSFVEWTVAQGLWGLENLAGIPGTVGAAPIQNIGAYGIELADRLHSLTVYDTLESRTRVFGREECGFSYRNSLFKRAGGRFIVLDVTFALPENWQPVLNYAGLDKLPPDSDAPAIMAHVLAVRREKLPDWRQLGNAGSFFHNPVVPVETAQAIAGVPRYPQADGSVKLSAAWLIDACGLKGAREGNAGIYEKHALIVVNHGDATYADVSRLAQRVTDAVKTRFGIALTQEPVAL